MIRKLRKSLLVLFMVSLFFSGFQFLELGYGGRTPEPWDNETNGSGGEEVAYGGRTPEPWDIETKGSTVGNEVAYGGRTPEPWDNETNGYVKAA